MDSGDLILFQGDSLVDEAISVATGTHFAHVGIVLRDPPWAVARPDPKGLYLLESSKGVIADAEDGKIKFGVQIVPLGERLLEVDRDKQTAYWRRLRGVARDDAFWRRMSAAHDATRGATYDLNPLDWLEALWLQAYPHLERELGERGLLGHGRTGTFWCSALVAYVYTSLGLLADTIPWTLVVPGQFSSARQAQIPLRCELDPEVKIRATT